MSFDLGTVFALVVCGAVGFATGVVLGRRQRRPTEMHVEPARRAPDDPELELAFMRGKEAGIAELTVEFRPYDEIHDGYFSTSAIVGYQKQLMVRGVPFGPAELVVLQRRSRANKQQIEKMLALVQPAIEEAAKVLAREGVKTIAREGLKALSK